MEVREKEATETCDSCHALITFFNEKSKKNKIKEQKIK